MSRALNIDAPMEHVIATCAKHDAPISTIETLPSGCTRVVLRNGDAAAIVAKRYVKSILPDDVKRTPRSVVGYGVRMPVEEARAPLRIGAPPPRTR